MPGMKGRSGGNRIGAGRNSRAEIMKRYVLPQALAGGVSPLEYMLAVIRDRKATIERRDRMAMAAAPYCHARMSDKRVGMKDERAVAARTASDNTEWEADLAEIDLPKQVQ